MKNKYFNEIFLDRRRFQTACMTVCAKEHQRSGIGTLAEKTLHSAIKLFIEPNTELHEIKIGRHYADVLKDNRIFEIQTRSFNALRKKLPILLKNYNVTVVYPIPAEKRLIWINTETTELTKPRKSPKRGSYFDAFGELYKLDTLICDNNLSIVLMLIDMDEYRQLNGWSSDGKKGSTRYERIPTELIDSLLLETNGDYLKLLPDCLLAGFTSKDLAAEAKLRLATAQVTIRVLIKRGAIECIGKRGRLKLYAPIR